MCSSAALSPLAGARSAGAAVTASGCRRRARCAVGIGQSHRRQRQRGWRGRSSVRSVEQPGGVQLGGGHQPARRLPRSAAGGAGAARSWASVAGSSAASTCGQCAEAARVIGVGVQAVARAQLGQLSGLPAGAGRRCAARRRRSDRRRGKVDGGGMLTEAGRAPSSGMSSRSVAPYKASRVVSGGGLLPVGNAGQAGNAGPGAR
jgi:hypothetical protein